jgi:hypothetical protein
MNDRYVNRLSQVALLDPYGKLHYFNSYCKVEDVIDESGNILSSAHEAIARIIAPHVEDPLMVLWKMGYVRYSGWLPNGGGPAFYKEPTQAQINTMYEMGVLKYSTDRGVIDDEIYRMGGRIGYFE